VKARQGDVIRTTVRLPSEFEDAIYEPGILGDIVEAYESPRAAYAVDLAIPDFSLVGGYRYDNVLLTPDQFVVVMRYVENEPAESQAG